MFHMHNLRFMLKVFCDITNVKMLTLPLSLGGTVVSELVTANL